ncbi:MAG: PhnD/SsuA/transferrin family substrate-binding protein [Candidatus Bipolaricaulia bacterium]
MHRALLLKTVLVVALIVLLGVGTVSVAQELGTRQRPIFLLLVPSVDAPVIQAAGDAIAEAIFDMTGLFVEAHMTADYAALIEAMRTAEGDTFAIPTTAQYVEIYEQTNGGVEIALASVRRGYNFYFSSFYVRRDSGIESLADLQGKVWIYNDPGSTSGYKFPRIVLEDRGIRVSDTVETGGHANSMIALLEGQGDFATGYGSPPNAPDYLKAQGVRWEWGDDPELMIWDRWNNQLFPERLRWKGVDLRLAVAGEYPEVWEEIAVLDVAGPIPNDGIAFVKGFPAEKRQQIIEALVTHIHTPEGKEVWGDPKFYEWSDMAPITDDFYNLVRLSLGYKIPDPFVRLEVSDAAARLPLTLSRAESEGWREVVPIWNQSHSLKVDRDNGDRRLSAGDVVRLTNQQTGDSTLFQVLDVYTDADGQVNINVTEAGG